MPVLSFRCAVTDRDGATPTGCRRNSIKGHNLAALALAATEQLDASPDASASFPEGSSSVWRVPRGRPRQPLCASRAQRPTHLPRCRNVVSLPDLLSMSASVLSATTHTRCRHVQRRVSRCRDPAMPNGMDGTVNVVQQPRAFV